MLRTSAFLNLATYLAEMLADAIAPNPTPSSSLLINAEGGATEY